MIWFLLSAAITVRAADAPDVTFGVFTNPERVTINNYSQDAMEPFVSLDGKYLFFNNSNNPPPGTSTKLYYATRIDDVTFEFAGEIASVNATGLNAVASMDSNNKFYFISTRSYMQTFSTVYWGDFSTGSVSNVELVPGVSKHKPGWVNFDAGISPDGNTLYFVDGFFGTANFPQKASLTIAKRKGNHFVRLSNSRAIMRKINNNDLNYAPSDGVGPRIFLDPGRSGKCIRHRNLHRDSREHFEAIRYAGQNRRCERIRRSADHLRGRQVALLSQERKWHFRDLPPHPPMTALVAVRRECERLTL